nr:putative tail knob protein [Acinetobacter phage Phanie]
MLLHLGVVKNPDNYLKRDYEIKATVDIRLKRDVDIVNPMIMLMEIEGIDFHEIGYAHIPDLARFYFVTGVELVHNKIYQLSLECDVLNTYRQNIKDAEATYTRSIKQGDYIQSQLDVSELKTITSKDSGVELGDNETLILTTVGGRK